VKGSKRMERKNKEGMKVRERKKCKGKGLE
jgi:hypothetical protein